MKASQEAQAQVYKEITKTNKMRDDDALFHSIQVYDSSNPAKFEKWIDSIEQVTCITWEKSWWRNQTASSEALYLWWTIDG